MVAGRRLLGLMTAACLGAALAGPGAPPRAATAAPAPVPRPPQFVVLSYDNVSDLAVTDQLRAMGGRHGAAFTFFLSGVNMLDADHRLLYRPPGRAPGSSYIGFMTAQLGLTSQQSVGALVNSLRTAQNDGHEVGSHFNGHFCGSTGVNTWDTAAWSSEIAQWKSLTANVDMNMGLTTGGALLRPEIGGRTPCLEGHPSQYFPAEVGAGWRYDASGGGRPLNQWPTFSNGLWHFAAPMISPLDGGPLLMAADYNFLVRYGDTGSPARVEGIYRALRNAFDLAYAGNRAPLEFLGHTTPMMGGSWYAAQDRLLGEVCSMAEVRCGTYRELTEWLDGHSDQLPALQAGAFTDPVRTIPAGSITRVDTKHPGAASALVNLTAVQATGPGHLSTGRCSELDPTNITTSNANPAPGLTTANLAVVPLDPDGTFCIYNHAPVNLIVDLQGLYTTAATIDTQHFTPTTNDRLLDTRTTAQPGAHSLTRVDTKHPGAASALVNLTAVQATGPGHLTTGRCSELDPANITTSNANPAPGLTTANLAVVPLDPDGTLCIYNHAPVNLIVDLQGIYTPATTTDTQHFTPTTNERLLDTRNTVRPEAHSLTRVDTKHPGAASALINLTAVQATSPGHLTTGRCSELDPANITTSNANPAPGLTTANLAVVPLDPDGTLCIYNHAPVNLIVDLQGIYTPATTTDTQHFTPTTNERLLDTRP